MSISHVERETVALFPFGFFLRGVEFKRNNNADIFAQRAVYIGPEVSVKPERDFLYVAFSLRHIVLAPWSI